MDDALRTVGGGARPFAAHSPRSTTAAVLSPLAVSSITSYTLLPAHSLHTHSSDVTPPLSPPQAVPSAINDALGTLPSTLDIQGLPFQAVFTYAVYTLSYVVVKVGGRSERECVLGGVRSG
jgi:hypothetical protein